MIFCKIANYTQYINFVVNHFNDQHRENEYLNSREVAFSFIPYYLNSI
jgi:hypothetical protein